MSSTDLIKVGPSEHESADWDYPPAAVTQRQFVNNRDFGDRGAWILISLMCALGLMIAISAYLLPLGQHAAMPSIGVH